MPRNPDGLIDDSTIWSSNPANKATPPFSVSDGFTPPYSQPISSGGLAPERLSVNFGLNRPYALGADINKMGGALQWDAAITYEIAAVVTGTDGLIYFSLTSNTNTNPISNPSDWELVPGINDIQNTASRLTYGIDSGIADSYVVTLSTNRPVTIYGDGMEVAFLPTNENTGASTINVNGIGVVPLVNTDGSPLFSGLLKVGVVTRLFFIGGSFLRMNPEQHVFQDLSPQTGSSLVGNLLYDGITIETLKQTSDRIIASLYYNVSTNTIIHQKNISSVDISGGAGVFIINYSVDTVIFDYSPFAMPRDSRVGFTQSPKSRNHLLNGFTLEFLNDQGNLEDPQAFSLLVYSSQTTIP